MSNRTQFRVPANLSISRWLPTGTVPSIYPPSKITRKTPNLSPRLSVVGPAIDNWDSVSSFAGNFRRRIEKVHRFHWQSRGRDKLQLELEIVFQSALFANILGSSFFKLLNNFLMAESINSKIGFLWMENPVLQ